MASNDKDSADGNPTLLAACVNEDQNAISANVVDQTLLKALQDLIVRVVVPERQNNTSQIHLGPEAGKLIIALQEFISSIVAHSQPVARNTTIKASLVEGDGEHGLQRYESVANLNDNEEDGESFFVGRSLMKSDSLESDSHEITNDNPHHLLDALEKRPVTFEEKLFGALRKQVFNILPIRLLSFEQHESSFQVCLLERGAIYTRLVTLLQRKMHEEEFRSRRHEHQNRMEADQEVISRMIHKYTQFAILSHTWLRTASGSEVTYADWNKGRFDSKDLGYQKLVNFCKTAWKHNLIFGWMDTVCINKESSSELDESIRSMYIWYERAFVCIVHLAETRTLSDMHLDPWFTRGWTLQELLAPNAIQFYNCHWKRLSDVSDDKCDTEIAQQVERATTISLDELWNIHEVPISRRMQLAATREVTREEDTAYSLMGIFNVSISIAYGEGAERAFVRLLQEILLSSIDALEMLNWAGELPYGPLPYNSRILPTSPKYYLNRYSNGKLGRMQPTEPLTLTHLGLRVPVILMPGISVDDTGFRSQYGPIGDFNAIVYISALGLHKNPLTTYNLLDNRIFGPDDQQEYGERGVQFVCAVFNFSGAPDVIFLPKTCIAIGLWCDKPAGKVSVATFVETIETHKPVVFDLFNRRTTDQEVNSNGGGWHIKPDELAKHGMQRITLYL